MALMVSGLGTNDIRTWRAWYPDLAPMVSGLGAHGIQTWRRGYEDACAEDACAEDIRIHATDILKWGCGYRTWR